MQTSLVGFGAALLLAGSTLSAEEIRLGAEAQTALSLTVYNTDLAMVRDTRRLTLPEGPANLAFAEVSARIMPETARLYGPVKVLEQNFDYDLLTPQKLLEKYVGRQVGLVRIHPQSGDEKLEQGTVLSAAEGKVVFRFDDRIETLGRLTPWRLVFEDVPTNLRERPTLTMSLETPQPGPTELQLAYLTAGLSWKADYVATLANVGDRLDLAGWVTLSNNSGITYEHVRVQLMAGDLNRVPIPPSVRMRAMAMDEALAGAPAVNREELFEYHLYTLQRPSTLADRQSKQVALMSAERVPVDRQYRIRVPPGVDAAMREPRDLQADTILRFRNDKPHLGQPLPAGIIRFYQDDAAGHAQFIGENRIAHTPEGREVKLVLGKAFDITATYRQTAFRKLYAKEREAAWEVVVHNAKAKPVLVQVEASFPGDWEILESSVAYQPVTASTVHWDLNVEEKSEAILSYRVHYR